ncbi:MAG TPA: ROK family protein [Jatrophihabitans sp.]|jgi:glucokinase
MTFVGIDVGGTRVKGALVSAAGDVIAAHSVATPAHTAALTTAVTDLVAGLRDERTVAVGVVSPGVVADGMVVFSANLPWRDEPVRDRVAAASGLPTALGHDVAAAASAEGREHGDPDLLFVALGTGIAAAHVRSGTVSPGATGRAGELGHQPVYPDGDACPCGQRGCLERYASAAAIARRYRERTALTRDTAEIARCVLHDDAAAAVWSTATDALAVALATCTLVLDPGVIVLGGGLAGAGATLLEPVRAGLAGRLAWRPAPLVRAAVLGADAGVLGAAGLALRLVDGRR